MNNRHRQLLAQMLSETASRPYQTNLSDPEKFDFVHWLQQSNVPYDNSPQSDYDMRGFYKDPQAESGISPVDNQIHFSDKFKTPYHQSFSAESQYADERAPRWKGNKLVDSGGNTVHVDLPR